jgi:hypothetical protein
MCRAKELRHPQVGSGYGLPSGPSPSLNPPHFVVLEDEDEDKTFARHAKIRESTNTAGGWLTTRRIRPIPTRYQL